MHPVPPSSPTKRGEPQRREGEHPEDLTSLEPSTPPPGNVCGHRRAGERATLTEVESFTQLDGPILYPIVARQLGYLPYIMLRDGNEDSICFL